jgi:hypothetical protein
MGHQKPEDLPKFIPFSGFPIGNTAISFFVYLMSQEQFF